MDSDRGGNSGIAGHVAAGSAHETHPLFSDLLATHGSPLRRDADDQECQICKAPLAAEEQTFTHRACRYSWHRDCLESWLNSGSATANKCPNDRQAFVYTPVLLPRDVRYRQHMAEVLATDQKCRDDQVQAEMTVAWRLAYEDFIGIPRAERLRQMVALLRDPSHPNRAPTHEFATTVAQMRLWLEEADYELKGAQANSAEAFLEHRNQGLRQTLF